MAIALVTSRSEGSTDTNGYTSGTFNATGANLLIVVVGQVGTGVVTDSQSNSYSHYDSPLGTFNDVAQIWYAVNPSVTGSMTYSVSGTGNSPASAVAAFSGADTSAPFDQSAGAGGASPGSITPTTNDQLIIAAFSDVFGGSPVSIDGGFTIPQQVTGDSFHVGQALAYLIQTTAAAASPTFTGGGLAVTAIASFKAGGGGGGGVKVNPISGFGGAAARPLVN